MKEVIDGDELVEGTGIQAAADLDVISSQQSHGRAVLLLKHMPLKRRAEQQQVVVCREPERDGQTLARGERVGLPSHLCLKVKNYSQNMKVGLGLLAKSGR